MFFKTLSLLGLSAALVEGCAKDYHHLNVYTPERALAKRGAPPVPNLSEEEALLVNSFENTTVDSWAYYYTHGLHIAGTNRSMAEWTSEKWSEYGVKSSVVEYDVYLNYPVSNSLSLTYPDGKKWKASLTEDVLEEDDTTSYPNRVPIFHGYSASGKAAAEYVYVGRGQKVDFDRLVQLGVELEGKIALARYGGPFR